MRPSGVRLAIVFGVSGVGKTYMVNQLASRTPPFVHFQASALLRGATALSDEDLRTASAEKIAENQFKLRDALEQAWVKHEASDIVLDAHSVIDNDTELVPVEFAPISATKPNGLIFLWDSPESISQRRESDTRTRPIRSAEQIETYQNLAYETCIAFSKAMQIELHRIRSGEIEHFNEAIGSILDRPILR